ncbi:chalcone isomerase-like protein 1 [Rutidosis leptorrhynchoides]|uniref:chalcone isomerase-like protein 1 n=1 Tax=Rutidosis leptorrhynchoides TaxID=125765 RepID=UPI003A99D533
MSSNTLSTTGNQDIKEIKIANIENEIHEESQCAETEMPVEVEKKTGVSFPIKLHDGRELKAIGVRRKNVFGFPFKIYSFGIYADNQKLAAVLKSKLVERQAKVTKEMYEMVIDNPVGITVKMVMVISNVPMSMVRKNLNDGIGVAIRKLGGGQNNELTKRIMGEAKDEIKLTHGSKIEVTCLPGYVLETKANGKVVNKLESELVCRAFVYLYLGEDPLDKEAKDKFGMSLVSMF